jgi:hypothetical protein
VKCTAWVHSTRRGEPGVANRARCTCKRPACTEDGDLGGARPERYPQLGFVRAQRQMTRAVADGHAPQDPSRHEVDDRDLAVAGVADGREGAVAADRRIARRAEAAQHAAQAEGPAGGQRDRAGRRTHPASAGAATRPEAMNSRRSSIMVMYGAAPARGPGARTVDA